MVMHCIHGFCSAEVDTVDRLLFSWSNDFPGMSDMVTSSVWPDHIKCTSSDGPLCSGLPATALSACRPEMQMEWIGDWAGGKIGISCGDGER